MIPFYCIIATMNETESAKKQYDLMTKVPVRTLVITLAIPTILSMMVTTVYNLVDTAFVGTLGTSASGAVGIVFGFMSILQAFGFMFGQGSGSLLSRRLGAKDTETASRVASTGFAASFVCGITVAILGFTFEDRLITFLGSTETIAPYAKAYLKYIMIVAPFCSSSFTLNNMLRYEGRAKLGMIGLLAGGIINIGGDALFIFGMDMGIAGAGLSTAISQVISFTLLLYMFLSNKTQSKLAFTNIALKNRLLVEIIEIGFPSLLRQGLGSFCTILVNFKAAEFAQDAGVSAMTIVTRISFFLFAIALGIGQGFQPVCAFNFGAGLYRRQREAYRFTLILSETVLAVLTVFALIFSGGLVKIFRDDPAVILIGTRALRLQCVAQLFLPIVMVTEMLMQSSGKKIPATVLSSLRGGLIFIPLLIILPALRGLAGVQEAQPVSYLLSVPIAIFMANDFFKKTPKEDESVT
ncbi:MAG: MATE family efflux transporter [Lachnospiraceae bacterium]|nr:MATE family efflux transporter [Lachnospiraceae bacterium]